MNTQPSLRQIVYDKDRALHFRRVGKGPPIVLLHESPRSSLVLMPLALRLANDFTVFALDTPGYGISDPLKLDRPSIEDFADAVARSLRSAGLTRVPVYGTHTGATIAAALGVRHPGLVSGLVLDGYPVFTRHERDLHEAFYLPDFSPCWDGSHALSLWSRVRDQFNFFPWYLRGESARQTTTRPSLEKLRAVFHDFLRSGAFYSVAYSASFRFDPNTTLAALTIPFHVTARETDVLCGHLERLPPLPDHCTASLSSPDPDIWAANMARLLRAIPGHAVAPAPIDSLIATPDGSTGLVDGKLLIRCYGDAAAQDPLILLHDTPGSARLVSNAAHRYAEDRLVITPELPGHGISEPFPKGLESAEALGHLIMRSIARFGAEKAEIAGVGFGDVMAKSVAAKCDGICYVAGKVGRPPEPFVPIEPELSPRWDGADLVASWFAIREREISQVSYGARGELIAGADIERMHASFVAHCLADGQDREFLAAAGIKHSQEAEGSSETTQ